MRGSPLLEWLLLLVLASILTVGLARITGGETRMVTVEPLPDAPTVPASIIIQCSALPLSIEWKQGNRLIWAQTNGLEALTEVDVAIYIEEKSCEFLLSVQWQTPETSAAVEVRIEPDGLEGRSVTFWSEGPLEEIGVVEWRTP